MRPIITDPDVLRDSCEEASLSEYPDIIKELEISLAAAETKGIGLAAPQIGIKKRVAIIRMEEQSVDLVNPIIVERDKGFVNFEEGCLSLPGVLVNTKRHNEIFVKDDLRPEGFVVTGLAAVAVAHECDHCDGILITDRAVGKEKVGRNDPCPCGREVSGRPIKYKKCCGR